MSKYKKVITGIPLRRQRDTKRRQQQYPALPRAPKMLGDWRLRHAEDVGFLRRAHPRIAYVLSPAYNQRKGEDGFRVVFVEYVKPDLSEPRHDLEEWFPTKDECYQHINMLRKNFARNPQYSNR
jgi:hypothetical protein